MRALMSQFVCSLSGLRANSEGRQGLPATLWTMVEWETESSEHHGWKQRLGIGALYIVIVCVVHILNARQAVRHELESEWGVWCHGVGLCKFLQNYEVRGTATVMCTREKCCGCVTMRDNVQQWRPRGRVMGVWRGTMGCSSPLCSDVGK